jgi:hypothetical protein
MNKFALANQEQVFVKKETVEGTLVYPSATNMLLAVGAASTDQENEFLEDAQIRARRSRLTPIKGRTNPGAWSLRTYIKPSGTAGTAPEADVLWECGLGKKTPDPGVKTTYSLDSTSNLPSFSMLRKVGHTVFFLAGCTVNQIELDISGGAIAESGFSGEFMKWWMAGESVLTAAAVAADPHIHVADATRFSTEKAKINIGSDTNGGAGYLITAVNYSTNIVSITPNVVTGANNGSAVTGWYPTSGVEVGAPVHGKIGNLTIDSTRAIILTSKITINNGIKYYTDLKNGLMYPTIYGAPGFRQVQGSIQLYFYKNMPGYFYRSDYQIQDALIIDAGSVSGKIFEVSCPRIEYTSPKISGDTEIMMELAFNAVGSVSGDDEISVVFK